MKKEGNAKLLLINFHVVTLGKVQCMMTTQAPADIDLDSPEVRTFYTTK